eukprot:6212046-Pleurochrysis_carterae.AAC.3
MVLCVATELHPTRPRPVAGKPPVSLQASSIRLATYQSRLHSMPRGRWVDEILSWHGLGQHRARAPCKSAQSRA